MGTPSYYTLKASEGFIDTRQFLTVGTVIRTNCPKHYFFYEVIENDSIHIKLKFLKCTKFSTNFPKVLQRSF